MTNLRMLEIKASKGVASKEDLGALRKERAKLDNFSRYTSRLRVRERLLLSDEEREFYYSITQS